MPAEAATVWRAEPGARVRYEHRRPVEFLPWLRSGQVETRVLINDLVHALGADVGPVSRSWRTFLDAAAAKPTVVDQYDADGVLLARYKKVLAPDEIWRLSLGRAETPAPAPTPGPPPAPRLDCGMLVFSGRRTLCHFQVVGEGTFATCHARRLLLERPPLTQRRWVPFPQQPGVVLSLLLMNTGRDCNRITVSRAVKDGPRDLRWKGLTVEIPRLGCRLLNLNGLLPGAGKAGRKEYFSVESTHPYDFYTVIESGAAPRTALSIQHVK